MRHQRRHVQPAGGHQVEHGLEVALLGPAHEPDRVILATLLVGRVVAPRPVGAAHLETQLLLVKIGPRQLQPGHADEHDAAALATHGCGLVHRIAAARVRGDEHRIDAATAGKGQGCGHRVFTGGRVDHLGAETPRQFEPRRGEIDTQHPAALGAQQLHGEQADQAQAGDHHALAQGGGGQAHPLQADRRQHGTTRLLVAHLVGNAGAQVPGYAHHLGMLAVAHHPVTHGPSVHARPDLGHPADIAVAKRQGLVELAQHRIDGGGHAVGAGLVEHHAHLVRLLAGLVDPAGLAELHQHAFGAGGNKGAGGVDEQLTGAHPRRRHLGQPGGAVFQALQYLFQTEVPFSNWVSDFFPFPRFMVETINSDRANCFAGMARSYRRARPRRQEPDHALDVLIFLKSRPGGPSPNKHG